MRVKTKYAGVYVRESENGNDKTFYARYRLGGRHSKEIEEPLGKASEGMTAAIASKKRASRIAGQELPNSEQRQVAIEQATNRITFDELFEEYCLINAGKPSISADKSRYKVHAKSYIGSKFLTAINNDDLSAIRNAMRVQGLAAQTIKHILTLISRVLKYASNKDYATPSKLRYEIPRIDNRKTEIMTGDQQSAYIEALDNEPDKEVAEFLKVIMLTGVRKSALLALEWNDIDFERNTIRLRGESAKSGKTSYIPMNEAVKAILQERMHNNPDNNSRVFDIHDNGGNSRLYRIAVRIRDLAGLPSDFRPIHGLRHNFASRLASSGQVDLYTLQRLLTHSTIAMTDRYAHLADSALQKAAAVAGNLLSEKGKPEERQ